MTVALWWRDFLEYAVFNMLWVLALVTVIGAPPATAAMYQMAYHSMKNDYLGFKNFFRAFFKFFIPAWKWAILQMILYGIALFNLVFYAYAPGNFWAVLRFLWIAGIVLWSTMNIFYWAFYIRQEDRRILVTYRNVGVMMIRHSILTISVGVIVFLLIVLSLATGFLLAFALMAFVALLGTTTVEVALQGYSSENKTRPTETAIEPLVGEG